MPLVPWKDEFTANTTTAGTQTRPDIVQLANGDILVVWQSEVAGQGWNLVGKGFDARGVAIDGLERSLHPYSHTEPSNQTSIDLIATGNGGFLYAYQNDAVGWPFMAVGQYGPGYSWQGSLGGQGFYFGHEIYNPRLAALSDTQRLVVWEDYGTATGVTAMRAMTHNAGSFGNEIVPLANASAPDVAALPNGYYVITAVIHGATETSIAYTMLSPTGASILAPTTIATTLNDSYNESEPQVVSVGNGRFAIAYLDAKAGGNQIGYVVADSSGVSASGSIGFWHNHVYADLKMASLPNGGFALVYRDVTAGTIEAYTFDYWGSSTNSVVVDTGTGMAPTIAPLADGRFAVAWSEDGDIRMEILDPRSSYNATPANGAAGIQAGTNGNDVFTAHGDVRFVTGGAGDDTINEAAVNGAKYYGDAGNDRFNVTGLVLTALHDGGDGDDTIDFSAVATPYGSYVTRTIDLSTGRFWVRDNVTTFANQTLVSIENAIGTEAADELIGTAGADRLEGRGGHNFYWAGAGDDALIGGDVSETFYGEAGSDYIQGGGGGDIIYAGAGGATSGDFLKGQGGDDFLHGSPLADAMFGDDGDDYMVGNGGADHVQGGAGNDFYDIIDIATVVVEQADGGVDTIRTTQSFSIAGLVHVENLWAAYPAVYGDPDLDIDLTGNVLNNQLIGNNGRNSLKGGDGADTLEGWGGDDILDGGNGADVMRGGLGDDVYHVGTAADQVIEAAGAGTDTVMTALASYTLGANIENGTMKGAGHNSMTGNALNNVLRGNAGNNILDGGSGGADDFHGGAGDDTYYLNSTSDRVFELAGEGYDIVYVNNNFSVGAQEIEEVILTGTLARNLTGGAGGNVLRGNGANNVLDGGAGADTLIGGLGNDTYVIDSTGDLIVELAGQGTDTVRTTISFNLEGTNVENATLTGTLARNLIGSSGANVLIGNGAANTLAGAGGADVLTGGGGVDRFDFNAVSDTAWATYDTITDLEAGDIIDLSTIDANANVAGNQAFVLVSAFNGQAGQLRLVYSSGSGDTYVQGDVDGDGVGDFRIRLTGDHRDYDNFVL